MQVKKQQLEPDIEQQTGSKLGKKYVSQYTVNVYCQPCLFNVHAEYIMQNARPDEAQAGMETCREKYQ